MKTIKIIAVATMLFFASHSNAQVSVNVNIGTQPSWAPAGNPAVEYYYIPDVQCYYDVRATQFIYLNNGAWIRSGQLPSRHRHYDLNRGYKVVLHDYHGSRPYDNYRHDRVKYYRGYNGQPRQTVVYNQHDHDKHSKHKSYGKGHGKGHGKGNKHRH